MACCPILDVHSQGKSEAEAIEHIRDAVNLFLVSCYERGVLDKALKECGFNPRTESADASSRATGMRIIDVPLQLIPSGAAAEQCHA